MNEDNEQALAEAYDKGYEDGKQDEVALLDSYNQGYADGKTEGNDEALSNAIKAIERLQ